MEFVGVWDRAKIKKELTSTVKISNDDFASSEEIIQVDKKDIPKSKFAGLGFCDSKKIENKEEGSFSESFTNLNDDGKILLLLTSDIDE